jgi:transcriptional regulator with XRE-family HTH domain
VAPEADILKRLGALVRARREALDLTQEALAAKAGMNRSYIGDTERGARNVALTNLVKLAAALDFRLTDLIRRLEDG